jgi:hypothetical protein
MTSTMSKDGASKALYAALGAPLVTGRKIKDLGSRLAADYSSTVDEWVEAGRELTGHVRESKVVEQVQSRVDVEQLQAQVEKLRDQLETVLANWRKQFMSASEGSTAQHVVVEHDPEQPSATEAATAEEPAIEEPAAQSAEPTSEMAAEATIEEDAPAF